MFTRTLAAIALVAAASLPQDRGAPGAWQKLLKLRTIASVMHTTAHPDDEHGGLLTMLSRGEGARVTLLTLTRGESGDNAIGPELFDALGLIRTEELLRADEHYGVDQQYFTTAIDYGFSKRLEEALAKWGRENVLRDIVRVVRTERPLVLVARFQGNERDGHGNHQAAGLLTREAWQVAGDAGAFPEQIRDGLRPWQPMKLYMGGVRDTEDWTLRVDTNVYSPWIGDTYAGYARLGLSFQRSQNAGRVDRMPTAAFAYYKRVASRVNAPAKESSFFDGIDLHPAWFAPIEREANEAIRAFRMDDPSASVPALARGLAAVRDAERRLASDADALHQLTIKEQQFADAIDASLGVDYSALAQVGSPVVPGQSFDVQVRFESHGSPRVEYAGEATRRLTVPADAPLTRPYFTRASLAENRYTVLDESARLLPWSRPAFVISGEYRVDGVSVPISTPVRWSEPRPPYGTVMHPLAVVPALALAVTPRQAIVPLSAPHRPVHLEVELTNNAPVGTTGQIALTVPPGWRAEPAESRFALTRAGEKTRRPFTVFPGPVASRDYTIEAVATAGGRRYTEGYEAIEHRDLETRYLYRPAATRVRGVDVKVAPGLRVGYVMGVGDEVPAGIAQLGADVRLLTPQDLAAADLGQYAAIVTGTRAYGVREDLRTYNRRLLEYVKNGGNLIVLYNTPAEFDPHRFAPYPAELPRDAEEVSEEDSPVRILAPDRPEFTTPNAITAADFDGWVEQRGSKFFSEWDRAYTPMLETHDQGQAPQRGGWVTAAYGKGRYTYFAYAFHRQLPYGVPGAYRLLANLLSLTHGERGK